MHQSQNSKEAFCWSVWVDTELLKLNTCRGSNYFPFLFLSRVDMYDQVYLASVVAWHSGNDVGALRWTPTSVPAVRPKRCHILSNHAHWQDYIVAYLNYTLQTMMPLPGWPVMAPKCICNNNNKWSYSTLHPVSNGMGDHLWMVNPARYATSHPGQLNLLPSAGQGMSTDYSVMMLCSWGVGE